MRIVIEIAICSNSFPTTNEHVKRDILSDWNSLAQIHEKFPRGTCQEHIRIPFYRENGLVCRYLQVNENHRYNDPT